MRGNLNPGFMNPLFASLGAYPRKVTFCDHKDVFVPVFFQLNRQGVFPNLISQTLGPDTFNKCQHYEFMFAKVAT